jgi:hypothetical protein
MFSEKFFSVAIGQILAARVGPHVVAEFMHPVLAPLMRGPGLCCLVLFWPIVSKPCRFARRLTTT